ncbi:uncharacterized protein LOC143912580 [Arctopsyche grandis]|uniref:uncharacterized protein LOC143912580 n=1 Tax=Arctopsyche grandis TaxID=121162 RepID=UPI00406D7A90
MKFVFVITLLLAAAFANDADDRKTKEAQPVFQGVVPISIVLNSTTGFHPSNRHLLIKPSPIDNGHLVDPQNQGNQWHSDQVDKSHQSSKCIFCRRPSDTYSSKSFKLI